VGVPDELLTLAADAAGAAAELLLARLHEARALVETKTSGTDMVTDVDRASEALLIERLLGARPHDGFLGEETGERVGTSGVRWVVDPLDGTTNYLYGFPGFNVSVAAEDEHGTVVGVVVDPSLGETYRAARGGGATRNGAPIRCSAKADLATALVATGFGYDPARRGRQGAVAAAVLPRIRDLRRMGSAAVDLCSVAGGRVDAYYERGLNPWDWAAGSLIATEAGATVGSQEELGYCLAAPPALFDALRGLLDAAGAAEA
jgi:fructose-1,6-bisphosphatase/inositol monophosphatase family enzyme